MADHEGETGGDGTGDTASGSGHAGGYATERTTAPQSHYSARDVAVGVVVLAAGLVVTFAVPLAATL